MWILMVEAGVALFLLVFIVWWTMFAGRKPETRPERRPEHPAPPADHARNDTPGT